MTHVDLFSGIGGFALAAKWAGFTTVAFVEIEPYVQEIIKERFGAVADATCKRQRESAQQADSIGIGRQSRLECEHGGASSRPILFSDITQFDGTKYRGATLVTGGFPCQPFSQAGKRRGASDDRALWPEMFRVIREIRPAWVLGENVAGFVTMELDNCISDLEREGYSVQPLVIPACAVDARHRRDRVWIVGHADDAGRGERRGPESVPEAQPAAQCGSETLGDSTQRGIRRGEAPGSSGQLAQSGEDVADDGSDFDGRDSRTRRRQREHAEAAGDGRRGSGQANGLWLPEPDVGRVAHGVSKRVDRLKGLGNAIVPQVAYETLRVIAEIERSK